MKKNSYLMVYMVDYAAAIFEARFENIGALFI
jgi:hypothetical protein